MFLIKVTTPCATSILQRFLKSLLPIVYFAAWSIASIFKFPLGKKYLYVLHLQSNLAEVSDDAGDQEMQRMFFGRSLFKILQ